MLLLAAAALVAWRNVRLGRSDQKAAWRVSFVAFAAGVTSWALVASHVPTLWEFSLIISGLSSAAYLATVVGLFYLAAEPFIRRHWPEALISWLRVVGGRLRDPLGTSHLLVGVMLSKALFAAFNATGWVMVLVLLRATVRRAWMADAIFVLVYTVQGLSIPALLPAVALFGVISVWILRRFGFLSLITMFVTGTLMDMPLAATSWYASLALTTPILIAALAAWSLYVIVTSRPGAASRPASAPLA